jgi:hypothetical protein
MPSRQISYHMTLMRLRGRYGSFVRIEPEEAELAKSGETEARGRAADLVELARRRAAASGLIPAEASLEEATGATLHDLLRSYRLHVEDAQSRSGRLSAWGRTMMSQVDQLLCHHDDVTLSRLDFDGIQKLIDYWRNRPPNRKRAGVTKRNTAANNIEELFRALCWASRSPQFDWRMPADRRDFNRDVVVFHEEQRRLVHEPAKPTFSVERLAELNRWATPLERLLLYLGINCAFGAAESGRLFEQDCYLGKPHPRAASIKNHEFRAGDSYITFVRRKTGAVGDWLLWSPTVEMLRWGIARSNRCSGSGLLVVRETGRPLYDEDLKNAQAPFANLWRGLINRVRRMEDSAFPYLPFGALRDTIADEIRQTYSDELASLVVAHGSPISEDELLDRYANRPVGRLFGALRELESFFKPVFDAAPPDPTAQPPKRYGKRSRPPDQSAAGSLESVEQLT